MRALLLATVLVALVPLAAYWHATETSPVTLQVGPSTTVILAPLAPGGGVDFDAAMSASSASEQRLDRLLALLQPRTGDKCEPVGDAQRAALLALSEQPLRLPRPASHVTPSSQQLAPALLTFVQRVACSCAAEPARASADGRLLAALSAHLSSSNEESFYLLHPLAARAATECFQVAPADAARAPEGLHFYDFTEHLTLVRLGLLAEIVRTATPHFDVNVALEAFNEEFMRALAGAPAPPNEVAPTLDYLKSGDDNRAAKSSFLGRSFARQLPELMEATRTAHENAVHERRRWAGE